MMFQTPKDKTGDLLTEAPAWSANLPVFHDYPWIFHISSFWHHKNQPPASGIIGMKGS
jgi:hypothetical protein